MSTATRRSTVLVIEDEPDIQLLLKTVLVQNDFDPIVAGDGASGIRMLYEHRPALVLLDVGLPGVDGWEVLNQIREGTDIPVIMLTAHGMETDKVKGLAAGADDYLVKPFGKAELLARVRAVLRRVGTTAEPEQRYVDSVVSIDFVGQVVTVGDTPAKLTPTEYRVLCALTRHAGQILSLEQLLGQAWSDPTGIGTERVKFTILRLRKKLGWSEGGPIEAVRGFGYRYDPHIAT